MKNDKKSNDSIFYQGLNLDPFSSLEIVKSQMQPFIPSILHTYPYLSNRTFVDLMASSEVESNGNPTVQQCRKVVMGIIRLIHSNFETFVNERIQEGYNIAQAQILGIKKLLNIPNYSELEFPEVFSNGDIDSQKIESLIKTFQMATSIIPDNLKKKTPVPIIILNQDEMSDLPSFSSYSNKVVISLNMKTKFVQQIAEAIHEYAHLIEQFNPDINIETNKFLLEKIYSLEKDSLENLGKKYKKPFLHEAKKIEVYEGPFIDLYVGRTYGNLDTSLNKIVNTEVLSVGLEALFLNPTNFMLRDKDYFEFIKKHLV